MFLLRGYIAARAQLVTFVLFVLTIYFIERFLNTGKKRYITGLIVIPIIISNIHLAVFPFYFILYLPYIGEYLIYQIMNSNLILYKVMIKRLKNKLQKNVADDNIMEKLIKTEEKYEKAKARRIKNQNKAYKIIIKPNKYVVPLIIIMLICIFTGLLTPLKGTPYTYLIKTMQGNTTKNISEHLPLTLIHHKEFMVLLIIYVAILMFTDTKIKLSDLFLMGGLVLLAFMTRRQESMVILLGSFVLNKLICSFINKYDKETIVKVEKAISKPLGIIITMVIVVLATFIMYKPKVKAPYISEAAYPVQAAEWILDNLDLNTIRLYNEYNYGSYLLFRGIPVFIDSRADLYTPEFNSGVHVFTDFINLSGINLKNMQEKIDEYNFTHFIIKNDSRIKIYLELQTDQYKKIYNDNNFLIYEKLEENGENA